MGFLRVGFAKLEIVCKKLTCFYVKCVLDVLQSQHFFWLKIYHSRHKIYSPICIIAMVNHEGHALFLVNIFKKLFAPTVVKEINFRVSCFVS